MDKVSVVIPARNEPYLARTVDDLFSKAQGPIEVIVVLDGYWPEPPLKDRQNLIVIHEPAPKGMRPAINCGAWIATGKYLMKCDAHCIFDDGFDVKLVADCQPEWAMVPRRYDLRRKDWSRGDKLYEFQYISAPDDPRYVFKGCNWPEYAERVRGQKLVDLMTTQGSCWFMHHARFEEIGGLDEDNYGTMGREAQEVCLKTWLSGGRFVLSRRTWYAHWKRGSKERTYTKPRADFEKSKQFAVDLWTNDKWPLQVRKLQWLLDRFKPIPSWHQKQSLDANRYIQDKFRMGHAGSYPRKIKGLNRDGFVALLRDLGYTKGCEVGVEKGNFAELMCVGIPNLELRCVDPYADYHGARRVKRPHDRSKEEAHARLEQYNVEWLEMQSMDAVRTVPDESLDFVYIDGNHRYEYAMQDIIEWTKKVRVGGIVAGHDYYHHARSNCQVKLAVDASVKALAICPWFLTDTRRNRVYRADRHASWFWVKT
ncbi:MAG: glycosyltransferase [Deltaproteobacteria bacterium]|nr:glycosyltransferase [Deltaproteobacteria bacterium]